MNELPDTAEQCRAVHRALGRLGYYMAKYGVTLTADDAYALTRAYDIAAERRKMDLPIQEDPFATILRKKAGLTSTTTLQHTDHAEPAR